MYRIIRRKILNPSVYELEIEAPLIAAQAKAGQFVIVIAESGGERVPFTLADWNLRTGTITLVIQVLGKTSAQMMQESLTSLAHVSGPLGEPTHIESTAKKVIFTGGGLGIAAIHPIMRAYHQAGAQVTAVMGFRSADLVFWKTELEKQCAQLILATNDGSTGEKGLVTDVLKKLLDQELPDLIYAIGPLPMMKAVSDLTRTYPVKTMASLNPIMVDGIGMCGACRVTVNGQVRYACIEGPDFNAHEVDFNELILRNGQFKEQEDLCYREFLKGKKHDQ